MRSSPAGERSPEHLIVEEDRKPAATKTRGPEAGSADKKRKCVQVRHYANSKASRRSLRMIEKQDI
jgi:hypothetical protein